MSGLYSSINASVRALSAQSRALEIAGKNLANVNNPGYARQRVIFGDRGSVLTPDGAESLGLEALGIEQLRDTLLDRQVMREIGMKSSYQAEQTANQRAQTALGQSIDRSSGASATNANAGNGIAGAIDDFFNAFQSFAASPTDDGQRQLLLQKASILSERFQLADQRLAQVQGDVNTQIDSDVGQVNGLLASIAELNGQIGRAELNNPGSAVDLRDQRQAKIELLSAKLPVELHDSTNGQVQVVAKDATGADVVLVDLVSVVGGVTFNGTQLSGGSPVTPLALNAGAIKGSLTARDGSIQTLRNDLDQLARQLVTSVNLAYNPSGATGNFFSPAGLAAGTIALVGGLTPGTLKASDGGAAGDNTLALAVAQLATKVFSTGAGNSIDGTFSGAFGKTVSKLGQALAGASARVEDQSKIEQLVRGQRDAVSGVSLDEEMADLLKFQRSFQASSRVFSVMDDLLDGVVNRLGH